MEKNNELDWKKLAEYLIKTSKLKIVDTQRIHAIMRLWEAKGQSAPSELGLVFCLVFGSLNQGHASSSLKEWLSLVDWTPEDCEKLDILKKDEPEAGFDYKQDYQSIFQRLEPVVESWVVDESLPVVKLELASCEEPTVGNNLLILTSKSNQDNGSLYFSLAKNFEVQLRIYQYMEQNSNQPLDAKRLGECWAAVQNAKKELNLTFEPHYRQILAAVMACYNQDLMIISGGPGTGKTTVAKLVLWAIKSLENLHANDIVAAAPTGRARGRLMESLLGDLPSNDTIKEFFGQIKGRTLHSLLGLGLWREIRTLKAKIVIVDECSMMDVQMFSRLLECLEPGTRLILLGDKDQLPSVDAGQVLADLTGPFVDSENQSLATLDNDVVSSLRSISVKATEPLKQVPSKKPAFENRYQESEWASLNSDREVYSKEFVLGNKVVFLTQGQRVGSDVKNWWESVSQKDSLFQASGTVQFQKWNIENWNEEAVQRDVWFANWISYYQDQQKIFKSVHKLKDSRFDYTSYEFEKNKIKAEYKESKDFVSLINNLIKEQRILCTQNQSHLGVESFNTKCQEAYGTDVGSPIIIKQNQKVAGFAISNGDLGFLAKENGKQVLLLPYGNRVIGFPLELIKSWEYAFAMSVHKSQGSEFKKVVFVCPESLQSPLWTRQIVYTAVTRAKEKLEVIWGREGFKVPAENAVRGSLL